MANSFTFNSVDMVDYGLVVSSHSKPFVQATTSSQLRDRAYAFDSLRPQAVMALEVSVEATTNANLLSYLESIKTELNLRDNSNLTLDLYTDRYWLARFESMSGGFRGPVTWGGTITFILHDQAAYDNDETESDPYTIDEEAEECSETVGGTEKTRPVFTLTCNDTLADTTVSIYNTTTEETIEWTGSLVPNDVLEIDCEDYLIKLNTVASMTTVEGQFPHLLVGVNLITISGFRGTMVITYRERYV